MGHILDMGIDQQRADDIAATAAAMGEAPVYREFVLTFRKGRDVRLTMTVMGTSSCAVFDQHVYLKQPDEAMEVRARRRGFEADEQLAQAADLEATHDKARKAVARDVRWGVEQQAQMWRDSGVL